MLRQIWFELFKMSRRPRSYLGIAAFALINFFVMIGLRYGHLENVATHGAANQGFGLIGSPANAEFMSWLVVGSPLSFPILTMFMPFFICLVFGEIFGGESAEGTLRTVLTRPIRRTSYFGAKFGASIIYAFALIFSLGITAYLIGIIAFGRGGLLATGTMETPMMAWFGEGEGLKRLLLAYAITFLGASTVGMVAFLISSWLNNSLGAIGGAIMLLFTMFIVGEIPYFKPIHNYLFSTHLFAGQKAFLDPIPWGEIRFAIECLSVYIAVFFALSLMIFRRKDILT